MLHLECVTLSGRLHEVSLSLRGGEAVALIGPNGSGKSTLLGAMAGLLTPGAGRISLDKRPLGDYDWPSLAARRALLTQRVQPGLPMPVFELLTLGVASECVHAGLDTLMQTLELGPLLGRDATTLSGGELQRVVIARTLLQVWPIENAGLLLLDEPLAGLDLHHQHALLGLLRHLTGQGMGVVLSIHDLNLALHWADRLLCLEQGRLCFDGEPEGLEPAVLERVFKIKTGRVEAAGRHWILPIG
ncbi:ATP-binding cassette domain-containing protein [Aeromonas schubertii]|uniref:ATP-binding cassette domain-containing protein n=1 Tax=Aeromonas schubertii TaxID=652 RepID=UPI001CC59DD6|nr:ATP-binding cassette domain-containing protein [Aeromonas schubertii]MBZ6071880.1 ATP-binding cassette domain-containing protein [Aeromonas schubertii]